MAKCLEELTCEKRVEIKRRLDLYLSQYKVKLYSEEPDNIPEIE